MTKDMMVKALSNSWPKKACMDLAEYKSHGNDVQSKTICLEEHLVHGTELYL